MIEFRARVEQMARVTPGKSFDDMIRDLDMTQCDRAVIAGEDSQPGGLPFALKGISKLLNFHSVASWRAVVPADFPPGPPRILIAQNL